MGLDKIDRKVYNNRAARYDPQSGDLVDSFERSPFSILDACLRGVVELLSHELYKTQILYNCGNPVITAP